MRLSAAKNLPPRTVMQPLLDDIAWGHAVTELSGPCDVVALLPTRTKTRSLTKAGERLVDVYLKWENGPALALPDGTAVATKWSFTEQGKTTRGEATITARFGTIHTVEGLPEHAEPPTGIRTPGTQGLARVTRKVTQTAQLSLWRLVAELERYVVFGLTTANRRVAREIEGDIADTDIVDYFADRDNNGVIDEVAISKLAGDLLYGTAGKPGGSTITRLIHRAATTAINNQPLPSYLATNIYAQCESHVRREIGDPHIGRKVRRFVRERGLTNLDDLIEAYREAHPQDELGRARAIAALTAGKTVEAVSSSSDAWETRERDR